MRERGKDIATKDIAGVIAPPPLIFGGPLVAGLVFHSLGGGLDIPLEYLSWPLRAFGGATITITGAILIVLALLEFKRADTPPEPWEETRTLTQRGPYRVTRNPMYLGMALAYFGIAFMAGCVLLLAMLLPVLWIVDRKVVAREEAYLSRKFGAPYDRYRAASRRWL